MSASSDRYDALAAALVAAEDDVTLGRAFRDGVLKVGRKIFAMPDDDGLILKLPADRCRELVEDGVAARWHRGQQKAPMREWVAVGVAHADAWPDLALEALRFVRGPSGG